MKKIILFVVTSAFLFSSSITTDSVTKALNDAKSKYSAAKSVGAAWKGSKKNLKKAGELLSAGKLKKALKLANKVSYSSYTALVQSKEADATWELAVPK